MPKFILNEAEKKLLDEEEFNSSYCSDRELEVHNNPLEDMALPSRAPKKKRRERPEFAFDEDLDPFKLQELYLDFL